MVGRKKQTERKGRKEEEEKCLSEVGSIGIRSNQLDSYCGGWTGLDWPNWSGRTGLSDDVGRRGEGVVEAVKAVEHKSWSLNTHQNHRHPCTHAHAHAGELRYQLSR